jgi:DTW domain-containing protein YfiP
MFCSKCSKHMNDCICDDIDERWENLENNDHFIFRKCEVCGKHYSRCKCEDPKWVSSNPAFPLNEAMAAPTLADLLGES